MNRRVPNGTHGGVRGRELITPSYSITEMGKLAKDSGSSAAEIKDTLDGIVDHLGDMISSIKDANHVAKNYMESINSIKSVLAETISLADRLEKDIE